MEYILEIIITAILVGLLGAAGGYWIRKNIAEAKIASAETAAKRILDDAEKAGESKILLAAVSAEAI